jgi:signal transduction histidine kinase
VPRSRNTRLRPKNTSRAEARRRYREDQRETEIEDVEVEDEATAEQPQQRRSAFAMPDVADDLRHLPQIFFSRKLVWLPFGLLGLTFVLSVALINGALDDLPTTLRDGISLYISLTLHPTSLFIFFIGGFLAPRGSYIVGGVLGVLSAVIYIVVVSLATDAARESMDALTAGAGGEVPEVSSDLVIQTLGLGLVIGILAGGFASWYRRFLRSSQERAAANRAQREREQAQKAKEQARADRETLRRQKYEEREARRKRSA